LILGGEMALNSLAMMKSHNGIGVIRKMAHFFLMAILLSTISGCMRWHPGLTVEGYGKPEGDVVQLLEKAGRLETLVDTREGLLDMVAAYETAAAADPSSKKALIGVANARILLATGYTASRWEKEEHYQKAMQAAEKALLLNSEFRRQVEAGVPVWEAVSVLGKDDADAMGYWSFGACYYYREVVPGIAKAWNAQWIQRARIFMQRIEEVDPVWNDGGNLFNIAIVYIALPQSQGGDLNKSQEYFAKSIEAGLDPMLVRWGRAKYLATRNKDREAFTADLEWVIAQNLREGRKRPYSWNIYFQREAKAMLANINELFQ
jgi:tetratricopeptide (TPR) repeat protein